MKILISLDKQVVLNRQQEFVSICKKSCKRSPTNYGVDSSDVSVFRTEESLQEGVKKITEVDKRFANVGVKDRSMIWNTDLVETLELQNLLTNATVPINFG